MMTTMHFRHELSYDAGPDEVYEMLSDPAFRERVGEAMDVEHEVGRAWPRGERR